MPLFFSVLLRYQAHPYNFYLFPSYPYGRKVPQQLDKRFLCQVCSTLSSVIHEVKQLANVSPISALQSTYASKFRSRFQQVDKGRLANLQYSTEVFGAIYDSHWVILLSTAPLLGIPYLSECDEQWWRDRRGKKETPTQEELNQFLGFSQVFKMIVESVGHLT